jgi:hypothetical protein
MVNYANSVVYRIMSLNPEKDDIYVGSACAFRKRKHEHKSDCNNETVKNIISTFTNSIEITGDGVIGRW